MSDASTPASGLPPVAPDDRLPPWVRRAILTFLVSALALFVAVQMIVKLRQLLILLLVSFFVSFALEPAVAALARRGWSRGAATGFVMIVAFVAAVVMVFAVGNLVVRQVAELVDEAPRLINDATAWINETFDADIEATDLERTVSDAENPLRDLATDIAGNALRVTASVIGMIFSFLTIALFAFYLTADGPKVRRSVCSFLPAATQRRVIYGWELAIEKTGGYLYSRTLLGVISATLMTLFLMIIDVPYAVALGVWMGVTSQFIPTVGTYIGGALPVLIALLTSPTRGLLVLVFVMAYQQVENYFLSPRITARTMQIHPAVAFGSVMAGAALLGGVGALLALPASAVIQAIASTYLTRHDVIDSAIIEERSTS